MLISYEDLSPVRKQVEIEIPADAVSEELKTVTAEFARHAKIAGFRPGKTPAAVIRTRLGKEIQEEVVQRLLPRFFHEAAAEKGLVTVGSPLLRRVDPLSEGSPLRFAAEFEIKPAIELREYRGIPLAESSLEVSEDEIDTMIERFREQAATFRPVEDRGAEDGDFVVIDLDRAAEGLEPNKHEGAFIQLGEETPLPELHDALRGKKPGDRVEIEKTHGEDAGEEELRGKTVRYEAVVKELRLRDKPAVDDAFAASLGFETAAAMREKVQGDLRTHKEHQARRAKREEAAERLVELHTLEAPDVLVEEELGNGLRNYARFLASQGIDLERAEIDWEKVRDQFRPDAVKRVKRALILEVIGKRENLTVADAEVDAEIRKAAKDAGREFTDVKHRLRHDGGYESLRLTMLEERALDFVVDQAKVIRSP